MFMVGTAEKVVGQHLVVGCAMLGKIVCVWLDVADGERQVVAVTLVHAVKAAAHGGMSAMSAGAEQHRQKAEYVNDVLHAVCKGTNKRVQYKINPFIFIVERKRSAMPLCTFRSKNLRPSGQSYSTGVASRYVS